MKKSIRVAVHNKYNGRCAYCGKVIDYKDMQVDHQIPKQRFTNPKDADFEENLFPACRLCNHYKRAHDLEGFRKLLLGLHKRIEDIYIVRVGIAYKMLNVLPFDGEFYFEWCKRTFKETEVYHGRNN